MVRWRSPVSSNGVGHPALISGRGYDETNQTLIASSSPEAIIRRPSPARRAAFIAGLIGIVLLASACGGSAATGGASPGGPSTTAVPGASAGGGGGAAGAATFTLSGGLGGQIIVTTSDCRKGSGQDTPTEFNFSGSLGGVDYLIAIGGFGFATGTYDLKALSAAGVSLESNPNATGSAARLFWAAPLRVANPGALGTVTATVTDSGGLGQLDAQLVQETVGQPIAGGSTVHIIGTWSCQFS